MVTPAPFMQMIKHYSLALFFTYLGAVKLTSSTTWFKHFTRKFRNKKKDVTGSDDDTSPTGILIADSDVITRQKLRNILKLCEEQPSENEVKLLRSSSFNFDYFYLKCFCFALVVCLTVHTLMNPFTSGDIVINVWCSSFLFWIVWMNFNLCSQVPMYIVVFIAREKLCRCFPLRMCSRAMGKLCDIRVPVCLRRLIYNLYVKMYDVKLEEAVNPDLSAYSSLNQFFRRRIKSHLRPICSQAQVVSPCDGTVVFHGCVYDGIVREVKGMCFTLRELFGDDGTDSDTSDVQYANELMKNPLENNLHCCVIYLAPGDYHRFHSPAQCNITKRRHIAGELISVKPSLLSWLPHLFAINERVVLHGNYGSGEMITTVAVGATNVGSIVIYDDRNLRTNLFSQAVGTSEDQEFAGSQQLVFGKGDSLGEFKFGSTLVVIYEAPKTSVMKSARGSIIRLGEPLNVSQ